MSAATGIEVQIWAHGCVDADGFDLGFAFAGGGLIGLVVRFCGAEKGPAKMVLGMVHGLEVHGREVRVDRCGCFG